MGRQKRNTAEKINSLNDGFTAKPHEHQFGEIETVFETGDASVEDAQLLGYTDEDGRAVEMARPDIEGSPSRSSVVQRPKTVEDAPDVGEETAP